MISESVPVDRRHILLVSKGVHLQPGGDTGIVGVIILVLSLQVGSSLGLGSDKPCLHTLLQGISQKWQGNSAEVTATSQAGHYNVGISVYRFHLLLALKSNDGLMQQHVIEHRAQNIGGLVVGQGILQALGDGYRKRPWMIRILLKKPSARLSLLRWRGEHLRTV